MAECNHQQGAGPCSSLNAAIWLGRRSFVPDEPLRADDIVLAGALGPMRAVSPGDSVYAEISGLGSFAVSFNWTIEE